MSKCPAYKIAKLQDDNCNEAECAFWDKKKDQCSIVSYMQAYFAMGLATLKMTETTERIEREYGQEED